MDVLVFDTESCDPKTPMVIQMSWCVYNTTDPMNNYFEKNHLIKDIDKNKQWMKYGHNITKVMCETHGDMFREVINDFLTDAEMADVIVAHNYSSDLCKIGKDLFDREMNTELNKFKNLCSIPKFVDTMKMCKIFLNTKKQMKNSELYEVLSNVDVNKDMLHDASYDVWITKQNFTRMNTESYQKYDYKNIENILNKYKSNNDNEKKSGINNKQDETIVSHIIDVGP